LIRVEISQISRVVGGESIALKLRATLLSRITRANAHLETRGAGTHALLRLKNQQMEEEFGKWRASFKIALLRRKNFRPFPRLPGTMEKRITFLSLYFPTGVLASDFFNVFPLERKRGYFICDVMGHACARSIKSNGFRGLVEEHVAGRGSSGRANSRESSSLAVIPQQADTTMFGLVFYVGLMSHAAVCVSLMRAIRPPFKFSTVMSCAQTQGNDARSGHWEFSNCQLCHVSSPDEKAIVSCSLPTGYSK
jgi:hypothetical protein